MNLSDALYSIALLLPGYMGVWAMGAITGIKRREWAQTVLYSLCFSATVYFIFFRLLPEINLWPIIKELEIQKAINQISSMGRKENYVEFHNVVKVAMLSLPFCWILGIFAGIVRNSSAFEGIFKRISSRSLQTDIWNDFHKSYRIGPHTITLKNGDVVYGQIIMVSDNSLGNDRGVIISRPMMLGKALEHAFSGDSPPSAKAPGDLLIFFEQIASIANSSDPIDIRRAMRLTRIEQGKRWHIKLLRKIRKIMR